MAFRVYDEDEAVSEYQREYSLSYVLDRLTEGGLEVRLFYSLQVSFHLRIFSDMSLQFYDLTLDLSEKRYFARSAVLLIDCKSTQI